MLLGLLPAENKSVTLNTPPRLFLRPNGFYCTLGGASSCALQRAPAAAHAVAGRIVHLDFYTVTG